MAWFRHAARDITGIPSIILSSLHPSLRDSLSVSRLNRFTRPHSPAVSRTYFLPSVLLNHHQVAGATIVLLSMLLTAVTSSYTVRRVIEFPIIQAFGW